jgi:uncharacterized protein involved in exopolysaccharide biosynthesis
VFALCLFTGWLTLQVFFTDLYETKASLLVKVGRENAEVPASVVTGNVLNTGVRIQDINSEVQMLSSGALVEAAVDKIGPDAYKSVLKQPDNAWGYPKYYLKLSARQLKSYYKEFLIAANLEKRLTPREQAIIAVADSLKIEPVKESDVLVMRLRLPSAELAVRTARVLLDEYLLRRAALRRHAEAKAFFDDQVSGYRDRLDNLMGQREAVRENWQVSAPSEERTLILKQLADLTSQRTDIRSQVARLESERVEISDRLGKFPLEVPKEAHDDRNPALETLKDRITSLRMDRAKLVGRYQADAPVVEKVDSEIADLEQSLSREAPTVVAGSTREANPLYRQFQDRLVDHDVQLSGLRRRDEQLAGPIDDLTQRLRKIDIGSDAFDKATREYKLAEDSYSTYSRKREEATISQALDNSTVANIAVIEEPALPIEPVYPRKLFIMAILLPVGLIVGISLAALLESMEDRIREERDLDALSGVIVLGSIPAGSSGRGDIPAAGSKIA